MRQDSNVVNLRYRDTRRMIPLPAIVRAKEPATLLQKIAYGFAGWAGLLQGYVPHTEKIETKTVRLDEKTDAAIGAMVLYFMNEDGRLNPARDLVILWGDEEWGRFLRYQQMHLISDRSYNRVGQEYRGLPVVLVSYLSGPLVIRRRDLEQR